MGPYRFSVNLKLGLIVAAVVIAVASLAYTNHLANRLREKEKAAIQLWARAIEHQSQVQTVNPYQRQFRRLANMLRDGSPWGGSGQDLPADSMRQAIEWAQQMPPSEELSFVTNEIVVPNLFLVPAIITDSDQDSVVTWRNVEVASGWSDARRQEELLQRAEEMDEQHEPIKIEAFGLNQLVHYGESALVRHLRIFPYVQLVFVALFILVGYLGFSYVRRSEQSSLWVGMAKEAAHQLGTPVSSIMGWVALLKNPDEAQMEWREIVDELDRDVARLQRVVKRFSTIGSAPELRPVPLRPLVLEAVEYIRRRVPEGRRQIELEEDVPEDVVAPVNAELFSWVLENLLKNAVDAIPDGSGVITVWGRQRSGEIQLDVIDTGAGIEQRQQRNIFRPGFSTKKRGWGLGLSLAKRVIEVYHDGELLLLRSRPGEGTTFRVVIDPAEEDASDDATGR